MLRGGKGEEGCHKCGHTHRQTEKDVNPTSRYSTGFSKNKCIKFGGYVYGDHSRFNSCIGQQIPIFLIVALVKKFPFLCGLVHHIAVILVQKLRNGTLVSSTGATIKDMIMMYMKKKKMKN